MNISELIGPDDVAANVRVSSKKQVLQDLSRRAAAATGLPERTIFDVLLERERLGTTGLGRGIAVPHGKLAQLDRIHGTFLKMERPVDFEAIDDQPVDLVFLLLVPEGAGADHLKALARVSRMLRDESLCDKLRGADSGAALYALLTDERESHAA